MTDPVNSSRSTKLAERLQAVYGDKHLTSEEFMALRDDADVVFSALTEQFPKIQALADVQRLSDELVQAMQRGILDIKKAKPDSDAIMSLKEGFGFQLAYIKICFDRFTQGM
ncbi:hypothetical protein ACCD10_23225 [Pseudomonas sp. Pseusp122]|uniref:hypothetical protein n=1 Tax=unclassified Pseudomonas TaxID=196821 RepID=UPI0039A6C9F8